MSCEASIQEILMLQKIILLAETAVFCWSYFEYKGYHRGKGCCRAIQPCVSAACLPQLRKSHLALIRTRGTHHLLDNKLVLAGLKHLGGEL